MSFRYIEKIPSSEEIVKEYPLDAGLEKVKKERDALIEGVILGKSSRILLIIGPCSADNEDSVCEYVSRLSAVQEKVRDKIVVIPRIYTNKPRTNGEGYKGILHQPDPNKAPNMLMGLIALRKMHIRSLRESGLTAADEMLYPENHTYLDDMLSYVAIGARSVENQQHRLTVSGLDVPVGMKNPTSGDLSVMLNSIYAAQRGHIFAYQGYEVSTEGNPLTHAILRGAVNKKGQSIPNYHYEDLTLLCNIYEKYGLANPMAIIDVNHANSNKKYDEQPRIVHEVLQSMSLSPQIKNMVRGFMIESYLESGSQAPGGGIYGKSITDSCLGWGETERLIYGIAEKV